MKFAIDIENEEIKKKVTKNLQDKGHNIVDCIQDKSLNIGESHYKKALLTNITKPEIFLRFIYVKNNDERLEIFADENVLSKVMSFNFEALLEEFNLKQLFMKNGRELHITATTHLKGVGAGGKGFLLIRRDGVGNGKFAHSTGEPGGARRGQRHNVDRGSITLDA